MPETKINKKDLPAFLAAVIMAGCLLLAGVDKLAIGVVLLIAVATFVLTKILEGGSNDDG